MKPEGLKTKIFLDSCDSKETKQILDLLGFLDGQTTNPTLVAKNPYARERFQKGEKFSKEEILDFYKKVIIEISELIPNGSVSVEVYADKNTSADEMFQQGKEMFQWIPNAHVKYPINLTGLECAEKSIKEKMRVNITLCFNQEQAGAVYSATKGAKKGDIFLSPFIGRFDDRGENGMDIIANIKKMYEKSDGHVEILSASVRTMEHFMASLALEVDIITAPFKILKEWGEKGMPLPDENFIYKSDLKNILYKDVDLEKPWRDYNIQHDLTDKGVERFASDWNALIE